MIDPPHLSPPVTVDEGGLDADPLRSPSLVDHPSSVTAETLQILEETLDISKRDVRKATVRVSTRTESYEEIAEVSLDRNVVDVTRVAVGAIVDVAPSVRTEGDVTIVPVVEERFVVVKQLYLKEELHIRHHVETETSRTPVVLRRQVAVVERVNSDTSALPDAAFPQI